MDSREKRLIEELLVKEEELPSLAKELFLGRVDTKRAFPFPEMSVSEELRFKAFEKEFLPWMERELDAAEIDRNQEIPESVIKKLGELGALGLTTPKEWGGLGFSQTSYCKMMERVAARCSSTALFINAHHSIGLRALQLFGTEEQKEKWLKKMATGEWIAAFSLTEETAGSDAASIQTEAIYDKEKKLYRITGNKQWTTSGSIAGMLTLMAKTEVKGEKKVTAFLVTPDMKGFSVTAKALEKVGMRGTKTANLSFDAMEVPEENLLGTPGKGLRICLTVLDFGRVTFSATCLGALKLCLHEAEIYAKKRVQFGRPLSFFPLIQEKLKRMEGALLAIEAATYLTAGLLDRKESDTMLESAVIKVFASEELWSGIYETMQIFGGRSFFTTLPFERMMRDARLNMIGEGANEVLRLFIAAVGLRGLGEELKKGAFRTLFSLLKREHLPETAQELKSERKIFEKDLRRFSLRSARLLMKYREEVVNQQIQLNGIADAFISLFTRLALFSYIEKRKEKIDVAKSYMQLAKKRFDAGMSEAAK